MEMNFWKFEKGNGWGVKDAASMQFLHGQRWEISLRLAKTFELIVNNANKLVRVPFPQRGCVCFALLICAMNEWNRRERKDAESDYHCRHHANGHGVR